MSFMPAAGSVCRRVASADDGADNDDRGTCSIWSVDVRSVRFDLHSLYKRCEEKHPRDDPHDHADEKSHHTVTYPVLLARNSLKPMLPSPAHAGTGPPITGAAPIPIVAKPVPIEAKPVPIVAKPVPIVTKPVPIVTKPVPIVAKPVSGRRS